MEVSTSATTQYYFSVVHRSVARKLEYAQHQCRENAKTARYHRNMLCYITRRDWCLLNMNCRCVIAEEERERYASTAECYQAAWVRVVGS